MKKCQKVLKSVKNYETILPFSCCPLVFPDKRLAALFWCPFPFLQLNWLRSGFSQKSRNMFGTGKRGLYERGLFAGEISRISEISKFSRISRKWSESPFYSRVWGFSRNSRISKFSRISRRWTFLKDPFSKRPPFPNPKWV